MKITPREKRRHAACRLFWRGVIFTRARVSLSLLSLRKNGGLLVVSIADRRVRSNDPGINCGTQFVQVALFSVINCKLLAIQKTDSEYNVQ